MECTHLPLSFSRCGGEGAPRPPRISHHAENNAARRQPSRHGEVDVRLKQDRCRDKIVYPDWLTAEREALRLMDDLRDGRLKRVKGGTVFAYPCSGHFHIGHQPLMRAFNPTTRNLILLQYRCFDRHDRLGLFYGLGRGKSGADTPDTASVGK